MKVFSTAAVLSIIYSELELNWKSCARVVLPRPENSDVTYRLLRNIYIHATEEISMFQTVTDNCTVRRSDTFLLISPAALFVQ